MIRKKGYVPARFGQHHSQACRSRIIEHMNEDPEHRQLLHRHRRMLMEGSVTEAQSSGCKALEVITQEQANEKMHRPNEPYNV